MEPGKVRDIQILTKDLRRSRAEKKEAQRRTGQRKTCHDPGLSQFWYGQTEDYSVYIYIYIAYIYIAYIYIYKYIEKRNGF